MAVLTLFHGTTTALAQKILLEDLSAHSYLTSREDVADYYGEVAMDEAIDNGEDDADYVILRVSISQDALSVDYNAYSEPLTYYRNDFADNDEDWFQKIDSGNIPYRENENDVATALSMTSCVKTKVKVSLNNITKT